MFECLNVWVFGSSYIYISIDIIYFHYTSLSRKDHERCLRIYDISMGYKDMLAAVVRV
jgi:hypothetical protein